MLPSQTNYPLSISLIVKSFPGRTKEPANFFVLNKHQYAQQLAKHVTYSMKTTLQRDRPPLGMNGDVCIKNEYIFIGNLVILSYSMGIKFTLKFHCGYFN